MRRSYKFRIYPTAGQACRAAQCLRDHQRLYNAALEERREAWRMRKVGIRYGQQSAQLKDIRAVDPDQGRWSFSSQQATLRRLDKAMAAFYRRCKAGEKRVGYPRFKALDRWDCVEWPSDGDGCRWKPEAGRVKLQGIGHVKVHAHRAVRGRVKTISLKREGRRWYVVLSCDGVPAAPLPAAGREIGIDVGVARFATTSDGVAAKSGLNKSILDAGWSQFAGILAGKAEEAARRVVFVNPARTSIDCHQCGRRCTRPRQDTVICPVHGAMDADLNGALNIYARAGLGSRRADAA